MQTIRGSLRGLVLPAHTEVAGAALADLSAEGAVALADGTGADGSGPDGSGPAGVPAYEVWRQNIRARLAARSVMAARGKPCRS